MIQNKTYIDCKEKVDSLDLDIQSYTNGKWRMYGFIRRIFCCLRKNMHLCNNYEYRQLYDECLDYLVLYARVYNCWTNEHPSDQEGWIEFLADLENNHSESCNDIITLEDVANYLEHRKSIWNLRFL